MCKQDISKYISSLVDVPDAVIEKDYLHAVLSL